MSLIDDKLTIGFGAVVAGIGDRCCCAVAADDDDEDDVRNQFLRYGSRFVVELVVVSGEPGNSDVEVSVMLADG